MKRKKGRRVNEARCASGKLEINGWTVVDVETFFVSFNGVF